MGAGASSVGSYKEDLGKASVEEVAEVYKGLSDNARKKVDEAFAAAIKEEPPAEDVKEEPAAKVEEDGTQEPAPEAPAAEEPATEEKPAEEAAAKEEPAVEEEPAVVEESAAPFLKKAFDTLAKGMADQIEAMMKGEEFDPVKNEEDQKKVMLESLGYFDQSFSFHDKDKTGTLDADEAKVFFGNLVSETGAFFENIALGPMKKACEAMIKEFTTALEEEDIGEELKASMVKKMREGIEPEMEKVKKAIEGQLVDYKANKEERDAAAFKVMDKDGSGKLNKEEFLQTFAPGTPSSDELMAALGITGPE